MKKMLLSVATACLMLTGLAVAQAQHPARNVNPNRHPNLAAAQRLTVQAFDKINNELKEAAEAANAK